MTKSSAKGRKKKAKPPAAARSNDTAVYVGLILIGAFGVYLGTLVSQATWGQLALGYLMAIAIFVNYFGWRIYGGAHLAGWQQSLAGLPLRCVGYGTRKGKPLDAAHGQANARMIMFLCGAFSVLALAGLSLVLI